MKEPALPVRIRRLAEQDAPAVACLEAQCLSMPWSERAFADLAKDGNSIGLVAEWERRVVGFASLTGLSGEGEVNNVATDPAFRCRGVAGALLEELFRQGGEMGISDFTLEVRAGNAAAIHLYERLGFQSAGIRPRFYEKPVEDAMIMWRRSKPTIPTSF